MSATPQRTSATYGAVQTALAVRTGQSGRAPSAAPGRGVEPLTDSATSAPTSLMHPQPRGRRLVLKARTGALDLPGETWRDRPEISYGDGTFLAGDMVAAPGLLSEVAHNSAVKAAEGAVRLLERARQARPNVRTL